MRLSNCWILGSSISAILPWFSSQNVSLTRDCVPSKSIWRDKTSSVLSKLCVIFRKKVLCLRNSCKDEKWSPTTEMASLQPSAYTLDPDLELRLVLFVTWFGRNVIKYSTKLTKNRIKMPSWKFLGSFLCPCTCVVQLTRLPTKCCGK